MQPTISGFFTYQKVLTNGKKPGVEWFSSIDKMKLKLVAVNQTSRLTLFPNL